MSNSQKTSPERNFRLTVQTMAGALLRDWVGEERAGEATGRIAAALAASAAAARDPSQLYECTPQSISTCVALAALTGIMPGTGSTPLAYLVPQRARKDDPSQLEFRLSHRGINALARRCGQTMIAIPVSMADAIKADGAGGVEITDVDIDNPPMTWEELRGVVVAVKQLDTGLVVHRGWVPKKIIERRRDMSQSWSNTKARPYSPWTKWPVEQAIKTGMHYAIARGWCVIDDTEAARALSSDNAADTIQVESIAPPRLASGSTDADNGDTAAEPTKTEALADRLTAQQMAGQPATTQEPATVPANQTDEDLF